MATPRTIIAIDLATTSGVAEWERDAEPRFYSVRFSSRGDDHPEAFTRARRWIDGRLSIGDVAALYVEATMRLGAAAGQTNADTTRRLVGLWAIMSAAAGVWHVKFRDVEVQAIRAAFLGNGRLRTEDAKPRAMEMAHAIGWRPNTLDEADAAALLHWGIAREDKDSVPLISPMLMHQVATAAENERILRDREKRERGLRRRA
jgi:hypothetical protein